MLARLARSCHLATLTSVDRTSTPTSDSRRGTTRSLVTSMQSLSPSISHRLATHLENLEKSRNLRVVRERSGKIGKVRVKVRESVFLHA